MTTKTLTSDLPDALPMQTRLAPIESANAETRTVDVVFSTGATVRRQRWVGWDTIVPFDEVLVVSRDAVNLERLQRGAPALDSHSMWSTASQVGVVEKPIVTKGEARATIRFPSKGVDERADRMFAMVSEGIIRNVSAGYTIDEIEVKSSAKPGEVERRTITRWTPHEISFVTIPADAGAQVRAAETAQLYPLVLVGGQTSQGIGDLFSRVTGSGSAAGAIARMRMRQLALGQARP